jgi:hypothetical protein
MVSSNEVVKYLIFSKEKTDEIQSLTLKPKCCNEGRIPLQMSGTHTVTSYAPSSW